MDKRIAGIEHDSDGWWVYLKHGFVVRGEGTHIIVETRKRDALDKMFLVIPCNCEECRDLVVRERSAVVSE